VPARPIDDEVQVLVNHGLLALVCLVLGLIQQAGMYHSSQVFGLKPMVGSMQRTRVWLAHCVGLSKARNSVRLVLGRSHLWSPRMRGVRGNIGPPGQETHGPPKTIGIWRSPVKDGSSTTTSHVAPGKFLTQPTEFEKSGVFATPFS